MKPLLLLILAALGGCATCEQHPVACHVAVGVVAVVVVGEAAAYGVKHMHNSSSSYNSNSTPPAPVNPCLSNPACYQ